MKFTPYLVFLTIAITLAHSSLYSGLRENVLSFLQRSRGDPKGGVLDYKRERKKNLLDARSALTKANIVKKSKSAGKDVVASLTQMANPNIGRQRFHMDPVLNHIARRSKSHPKTLGSGSSSSSFELQDWKDEWREHWIQKKFEAINSSAPRGDSVNMLAARPWGVPCGDPNQHDMPWGSCMLAMECEAEFRIYRGDYFCGRTQFVCCALQLTTYDMYQGFDVSFEDTTMETDSEEIRNRLMGSKERRRRKKLKEKKHRKRERLRRKRQIKRKIKTIIKEIRKILSRSYRNGTTMRKRKTKQLKRFIKKMKKQYKKDRKNVKNIHELELTKIDENLKSKLAQIRVMNQEFVKNHTFREVIFNGTASRSPEALRMLVEAYPELANMLDMTRRTNKERDYLNYDIEYGLLYY